MATSTTVSISNSSSTENKMKSHILRINSFKTLSFSMYKTHVWPTILAGNGFWFNEKNETIICFSCDLQLSMNLWTKDKNIIDIHKEKRPTCKYINGECNENIPLLRLKTQEHEDAQNTESTSGNNNNNSAEPPEEAVGAIGGNPLDNNKSADEQNDVTLSTRTRTNQPFPIFDPCNLPEYKPIFDPFYQRMASEEARLLTYGNWNNFCPVTPGQLAKAGFFYTNSDDRVQCAFCHGVLRNWEPNDDVMYEHRTHFPKCHFAHHQNVGNIPIDEIRRQQIQENMMKLKNRLATFQVPQPQAANNEPLHRPRLSTIKGTNIAEYMKTEEVHFVTKEFCIPKELIEKVIDKQISQFGKCIYSRAELLNAIYNKEEGQSTKVKRTEEKIKNLDRNEGKGQSKNARKRRRIREKKKEIERLEKENKEMKDQIECKICFDAEALTVLLLCGHTVCSSCAPGINQCHTCRQWITTTLKINE